MSIDDVRTVLHAASDLGAEWIYLCGLGEPTDDPKFMELIQEASKLNMSISMFTNAAMFNDELVQKLADCNISLIVKLDSLVSDSFDKLLGKRGTAKRIYQTIDRLFTAGYDRLCQADLTRLAASIIPTRVNFAEIGNVVKYCIERNIFPSIGELEYAGRAQRRYADLRLSESELIDLKIEVDELVGYAYERPICPAGLAGLHVGSSGEIIVDRCTGVCCQWFLLKGPDLFQIGHISSMSLRDAMSSVVDYRKRQIGFTKQLLSNDCHAIFGGCGGRVDSILRETVSMHERVAMPQCNPE